VALHVHVDVHVHDQLLLQLLLQFLGELRGADEAELLGIPESKRDGPRGTPAGLRQRAEAPGHFEQCGRPGARIDTAEGPRVVVGAEQDAALRRHRAAQGRDNVVDRSELLVHVHRQRGGGRPWADVVGELQAALEGCRCLGPPQRRQQVLGFAPADRNDRNFRKRRCGRLVDARRVGRGRHTWGQRITMPVPAVLRVAALEHLLAAPVAARPGRPFHLAVVGGVAVENQRACARLFGGMRFDGSMAAPVSRDDDLVLHRDPEPCQLLVVGWEAVVDVDDRRRRRA
jgi:hypothetical protein